jgi:hypothetical protein
MLRRLPLGTRVIALLASLAALVAAGCGGSGSTTSTSTSGPDPATVTPAGAVLYGEATVRPSGAMKEGVVAAARKVLRVEDPGAELARLLDESGTTDDVSFSHDIEPWLGPRVGAFLLMPAGDAEDPDWGIVLSIADHGGFDDALPRLRRRQHTAGTYRGVHYDVDESDDTYGAEIGEFYVGGTLVGVRAAIDASRGEGLADASRFTDVVDTVPDDALAFVYADPKALAEAAGRLREVPPRARRTLQRLAEGGAAVASLTANADEIAIEGSASSKLAEADGSDATVSVGQLPGDAWLALATPPLGPLIESALDSTGVHDLAAEQVRSDLGLDLDRDLLDPLGGLGLFVRGSSLLDIGGGALLQLTDAAAAQRLLTRIEAIVRSGAGVPTRPVTAAGARGFEVQVPQSPQPIVVLTKGDRLAAGYAASSAQDLLEPQQRFDESSTGKAAIDTLGDGYTPSFVLIVSPLAALLRSLDQLQVADLSSALPYVNAFRSLAVGTKRDGDRTSVRVVAALR